MIASFFFFPAGSDGKKINVIQKCVSLGDESRGQACFPLPRSLLRAELGAPRGSQMQDPGVQSYVVREFLLLTDSWRGRRQRRLPSYWREPEEFGLVGK